MSNKFEISSINKLIEKIKNNKKMGFLRFGDGDICMAFNENIGKIVGASNQIYVTPEVTDKLKKAWFLESDNLIKGSCMAIKNESEHNTSTNVDKNLYKKNGLDIVDTSNHISYICIQECFLYKPEKFIEFTKSINKNRTIFVCQYYNEILDKYYGKIIKYIKCPQTNATKELTSIKKQILEINPDDYDQIILCCGQATRILIYDLWDKLDKKFLDVGSLSDHLISNVPSIFNNIKLRTHIRVNKGKIQNLVKYYNEKV